MKGRSQGSPTLDRYLKDSYEVIRYVHDNLPILQRIAGRLTPVEDLVEFKSQVEHLYAHLAVLVEASQIILQISDAGFDMMTAPSVPAQRALLGLGTAALRNEEYFAKASEFLSLVQEVADNLERLIQNEQETDRAHTRVDALEDQLPTLFGLIGDLQNQLNALADSLPDLLKDFATRDELEALKNFLQDLVSDVRDELIELSDTFDGKLTVLDDSVTLRISNAMDALIDGEVFTGFAEAVSELYARVYEVEGGLVSEAGRITHLESEIVNLDGSIQGVATAYDGLTTEVSLIDGRLTATARDVTDLNVSVADLNHGVFGSGGALDLLRTTVTQQGEDISVESARITRLSAEVTGLDGSVSAHADALSSLTSTVSKNENDIEVISLDTAQLQSRLDLVDDELVAEATAREDLETRVEQSETGLLIQGENITEVRAALTGPGNLLPNSSFESEPLGWFVRQRGSGWITVDVTQNLDAETKLPEEVGALGVSVSGVPAGELGISSPRTPVEPNKSYILSGYLAAENCTVSLEWRALNADGDTIEFGVAGEVTNEGGGKSLADWPRVHARIDASHDVVLIEAQLWVRDANTATPKAWLVRPMLEEASLLQEDPSPWVPSASGLDQKYAQATEVLRASLEVVEGDITGIAERLTTLEVEVGDGSSEVIQDLIAQVSENKDGIEANATSVTKLTSRLGAVTEWEIFIDEDAPQNSYLRLATEDENSLVFQRGITLVRFTTSGELSTSQRFDTFSGAGQRNALISALDSLGDEDYFVLVGQPNLGSKPEDLVEAFLRVGAHRFGAIVPSRAYVLLGRGGIGPGGGVEYFSRNDEDSLRVFFTLVRDAPKEIGGFSAAADALSEMSTSVEQNKDGITAVSQSMSLLGAETPDGQGWVLDEAKVHITPTQTLSQKFSSIDATFNDPETGLAKAHSRITAEALARSTADTAFAQNFTLLGAKTANGQAWNLALDKVMIGPTETINQRLNSITSDFNTNSSRIATEEQARADGDSALGERINSTVASIGQTILLMNPDFELEETGWQAHAYTLNNPNAPLPDNVVIYRNAGALAHTGACALRVNPPATAETTRVYNSNRFSAGPGDVVSGSVRMRTHYSNPPNAGTRVYFGVRWYNATNGFVSDHALGEYTFNGSALYYYTYDPLAGEATAPAETAYGRLFISVSGHFQGSPGALYFDAAEARRGGTVATASDLSLVRTEVTQQGDTLTALGERVDLTQASLGRTVLVQNGSFERGMEGWGSSQPDAWSVIETASAYHGKSVLQSAVTGSSFIRSNVTFEVKGGDRVHLRAFVRPAGTSDSSLARIAVRWGDADGNLINNGAAPVSYSYTSGAYVWEEIGGEVVAPANAVTGWVILWVTNASTMLIYWDQVEAELLSETEKATAAALDLVTVDVQSNSQGIASHGQRLQTLEQDMPGKASTSYVNQVKGQVEAYADNAAAANLALIQGLDTTVGTNASSINELREVSVSAAGGNAIVNASFEKTGTGKGWGAGVDGTGSYNGYYFASAASRSGGTCFRFDTAANLNNAGLMAVPASRQIRVGFHSRHVGGAAPTSYIRFSVRGFDAQMNQVLFTAVGGTATRAGGGTYDISWQKNERVYTVPDDVIYIRGVLQTTTGDWTGHWMVDDVFMEPVAATDVATGERLDTMQVDLDGKATVGYVNQVKGQAEAADGKAEANILAIQGIQGDVAGNTASVTQAMEVAVAAASGNLVRDPSFELNQYWDTSIADGGRTNAPTVARSGNVYFRLYSQTAGNTTSQNSARIPVEAGRPYRFGYWFRSVGGGGAPNGSLFLPVWWYAADGTYIGSNVLASNEGQHTISWTKAEEVWTPPAGTAEAIVGIRSAASSGADYAVDDVFVEAISEGEATMMAKYSLAVTAGGDVSGMQLLAGGGTSAVRFLADSFSVVDPSGGSRMEWSNGNIRVYDASRLRVRLGVW